MFTRIEVYKHEDILKLMEDVGITNLHIGLEFFNNESLDYYNKHQSREQVIEALKTIKKYKLRISGSFVLGTDVDTVQTTRETVDVALKYGVHNYIGFSLMEFPNLSSPGLVPYNRMVIRDYDYGNGTFVFYFPKNMRPSVLQREMNHGMRRFYAHKLLEDVKERNFHELYYKLSHFPLFMQMSKHWNDHVHYLERMEEGMYDENDHLIESKLGEGIFPPDTVRPWLPEVQAKVVHPPYDDDPHRPDPRAGRLRQERRQSGDRDRIGAAARPGSNGRLVIMEIRRISLIAPKPTVPLGASHYLVMLFWGLPLIGTILKERGYEVRVFFEIVKPIDWDYRLQLAGGLLPNPGLHRQPHLRVHPAHQGQQPPGRDGRRRHPAHRHPRGYAPALRLRRPPGRR